MTFSTGGHKFSGCSISTPIHLLIAYLDHLLRNLIIDQRNIYIFERRRISVSRNFSFFSALKSIKF